MRGRTPIAVVYRMGNTLSITSNHRVHALTSYVEFGSVGLPVLVNCLLHDFDSGKGLPPVVATSSVYSPRCYGSKVQECRFEVLCFQTEIWGLRVKWKGAREE